MLLTKKQLAFIRSARVAHLATADAHGRPHVIPICFAFDGKYFYSPIDEKPKRSSAQELKRIKNIRQNPNVALVIDHYEEVWEKLGYVIVLATARVLLSGFQHRRAIRLLRQKYSQYRAMALDIRPTIVISPKKIVSWGQM